MPAEPSIPQGGHLSAGSTGTEYICTMHQRRFFRYFWAAALAVLAPSLAQIAPAHAGDLRVVAEGVRSDKGNVIFAIHRQGEPFPDKDSPYEGGFRRAAVGSVAMTFGNLPPGRYALVVVHDEDLNRVLDISGLGVPTRGFGFSNNTVGLFEPPSFPEAAFEIKTDGEVTQSIRLIYLPGSS